MQTLWTHDAMPVEQLDQLESIAETTPPELHELLMGLAECLRRGAEVVAVDPQGSLTPAQVARMLGMSRGHLYKLMDGGQLPFDRVGRDRRIRPADVAQFEAQRQSDRRELAERFAHQQQTTRGTVDEIADLL